LAHHFNTPLTREVLGRLERRRLSSGRNLTKACLDLVRHEDGLLVVKDVATRPLLVRALLGPLQMRREARAYKILAGIRGIPALLQVIDRRAIALQYIDGPPLRDVPRGELPASFFDALATLVAAVHARGVAHGDLHHGDVLVGPEKTPYLVDFSTAVFAPAGGGGPIFAQWRAADLRGVAKLRRRWLGGDAAEVPERPGLYRVGARLRRFLRFCGSFLP
jgi:serine/threonine protein kinase